MLEEGLGAGTVSIVIPEGGEPPGEPGAPFWGMLAITPAWAGPCAVIVGEPILPCAAETSGRR